MNDRSRSLAGFAASSAALLAVLVAVTWSVSERTDGTRSSQPQFAFAAMVDAGLKVDEAVDAGEVGRLVRAGSVHTSWAHLAVNAVGLVVVGLFWWRVTRPAERGLARAWVMPALCVCASTAGFTASYLVRAGPSGGVSAGVYGLLAAVAGATWVQRRDLPERMRVIAPAMLTALSLACVLVLLPNPTMDHAAHLGGWAFGLPAGAAVQTRIGRVVIAVTTVALLVVAVFAS